MLVGSDFVALIGMLVVGESLDLVPAKDRVRFSRKMGCIFFFSIERMA